MDRASIIFCGGSLAASLLVAWLCFPMAALDRETIARARTPQPAETMAMIDVGHGFGEVPAVDLMDYYIENPPAPAATGAASAPAIKFGGC